MIPIRVTPPAEPVVPLVDLRKHLRVDTDQDDVLITMYEKAAVAHLDGYRGLLGRAIREQVWAVTYGQAGTYRLPLPDVVSVTATDAGGDPVGFTLCKDALGTVISLSAPAEVRFTVALPGEMQWAVEQAIKILVGHWYENREAVSGLGLSSVPLAFDALIGPIRWTRV